MPVREARAQQLNVECITIHLLNMLTFKSKILFVCTISTHLPNSEGILHKVHLRLIDDPCDLSIKEKGVHSLSASGLYNF